MSKIILQTDENAAVKVNMDLFKSLKGNYFITEESAREDSATHNVCKKCGIPVEKSLTLCDKHKAELDNERYLKMPFKEWDMKTPLVQYGTDKYFWDSGYIEDYCDENEIDEKDLQLVICEPVYLPEIDEDYFCDYLPDEQDELPIEVQNKLKEFNEFLKSQPPVSWTQGSFRTEYKFDEASDATN